MAVALVVQLHQAAAVVATSLAVEVELAELADKGLTTAVAAVALEGTAEAAALGLLVTAQVAAAP